MNQRSKLPAVAVSGAAAADGEVREGAARRRRGGCWWRSSRGQRCRPAAVSGSLGPYRLVLVGAGLRGALEGGGIRSSTSSRSMWVLLRALLVSVTLLKVATACESSRGGGCMSDSCCAGLYCNTDPYWDEWCASALAGLSPSCATESAHPTLLWLASC